MIASTIDEESVMNKDEFREWGYQFVDWVAEYLEDVGQYPVRSELKPGDIKNQLPMEAPLKGEPMENIFDDFKKIVVPGITHWQHPSWFAYFSANNSPPSILAELLTAGIGAQCMLWETSPAAAELEEVVLEWLRKLLGLPEGLAGVIQDTASTASLVALLTAREQATEFESNRRGIKEPLMVYVSEEAHSSVEKGAKIAGYGTDNIRKVSTDHTYAMIPEELKRMLVEDKAQGLKPTCVVATLGTTSSSAMDPLEPIGRICRQHKVWLHVDAAYAGTAALLPEKQWMFAGAENVDSLVFNPHKWMLTNFDCSAYYVKDPGALIRTFEIHPEYLKTGVDSQVKNYRDWGIQLGRRFRALKLWFVLRSYGVEGLQAFVREHIRLAQLFREWVEEDSRFELMAPVPLSLVCFRLNDGRSEEDLDRLNRKFITLLNQSGKLSLTQTTLKGKFVLRMAIDSHNTREEHVQKAWQLMLSTAQNIFAQS
jgi:aromatic-L-amino-acid decarboxylase